MPGGHFERMIGRVYACLRFPRDGNQKDISTRAIDRTKIIHQNPGIFFPNGNKKNILVIYQQTKGFFYINRGNLRFKNNMTKLGNVGFMENII